MKTRIQIKMQPNWNLNYYIHVQIRDDVVLKVIEEINRDMPDRYKTCFSQYAERNKSELGEGWYKMQGWVFMQDYGRFMRMGFVGINANVVIENAKKVK